MAAYKLTLLIFLLLGISSFGWDELRDVVFKEGYNVHDLPPRIDGKPLQVNFLNLFYFIRLQTILI